jgi:alanine dehydrogenase
LDWQFSGSLKTIFATQESIEKCVLDADLVVGAVLVVGAAAPKLVTREMVSKMRPGSVLVDVAIDQGGCFETSRPTTHAENRRTQKPIRRTIPFRRRKRKNPKTNH